MQLSFVFRSPVTVCAGALATEERLVAEVAEHLAASRRDPSLLARPVLVVVPSRSLRLHVASVLASRLGPHLLGVTVHTFNGLANEIVGGRDEADTARLLGHVLALRHARAEAALAPLLDDYDDAEGALIRSVHELVDAGLGEGHVDAAVEAIAEAPDLAPGEKERAAAIVRAAARTAADAERLAFHTPTRIAELAAAKLARTGAPPLNARAVLLHGFAAATGVDADLLERLTKLPGARLFVDLPPDPAQPDVTDAAVRYGSRFRERIQAGTRPEHRAPPGAVEVFAAEGDDGEALETVRRVAEALDAGARPEGVGIVAHDLEGRAASLRRHLERLGVPWSGVGVEGPDTPVARWRRLVALLRLGPRVPMDHWLDLLGRVPIEADPVPSDGASDPASGTAPDGALPPPLRASLRLGLRAIGAARLGQAARLDAEELLDGKAGLTLPGGGGFDGPRVDHRVLDGRILRGALAAARETCAWHEALPARARPAEWHAHLRALVVEILGQPDDHAVLTALAPLAALPGLTLEAEELRVIVARLLEGLGRGTFGGAGAGVQVLTTKEARGRTFEHLFLMGNNRRSTNPRDAVLGDPVRIALRAVLPDLPLRSDRFDEDRFHFAWMLSAAPRLTLSFQTLDGRGKPASVSPLLERLRWAGRWTSAAPARPAYPEIAPAITTAAERATMAALRGGVTELAAHLPAAVASTRRARPRAAATGVRAHGSAGPLAEVGAMTADAFPAFELAPAGRVADARIAVLTEKEGPRDALAGPWQGWLGPPRGPDPRSRTLYVSTLEEMVACPWQTFLQRFLGAEPVPDPLARVPQGDDRLAGILVHRVLEAIVRGVVRDGNVAALRDREPVPVPWPAEALAALSRAEATRLLDEEGIRLPGLAELLAIRVEPLLEAARAADWAGAGPPVVGAEVRGFLTVDERIIGFRADRADVEHGVLTLTDYKTGRSFADVRDPGTRREHLLARIRSGRSLQAAAYAAARDAGQVSGRYLFLGPDVEVRSLRVHSDDDDVLEALTDVVRTVTRALEGGVFFPRVVEPVHDREPDRCRTCTVAEACLRGESGDRARLRELAAGADRDGPFGALWALPEAG